ncbi:hypothetical protein CDL15_Pgr024087 [Punica granatum]|uniref:RNase H type-1 domain-containing protein n=1 Tax=Punica granatum TaxID=22663 RepID=A0A218XXL6_PUNGR|nr:hypothetical protein CDL15_Pgr024087 [Punica granatum]PKI61968.1 hypothetical protein CRG98_017694 [Punica granatum]
MDSNLHRCSLCSRKPSSIAGVVFDNAGTVTKAWCAPSITLYSSIQEEAQAILFAASIAFKFRQSKIWIRSNALLVVEAVSNLRNSPWEIGNVISDVKLIEFGQKPSIPNMAKESANALYILCEHSGIDPRKMES